MSRNANFWQDRRVLVTGITGLVGGYTARLLIERGAHVVGLVRDQVASFGEEDGPGPVDWVFGSVEDYPLMERVLAEYEIETVFHLAAQTIVGIAERSPLATFESNIKGTWCVLEAARRGGARPQVIVASSDKAYGPVGQTRYTEETPLGARRPYDVSKACADLLALSYFETYGLPVCVTRCGNFFGGGDRNWNRLVPGTIRSILRGQRPVVRSDGSFVRDYFYVKDGAAAYLHLAQCMDAAPEVAGQAFNFSSEAPVAALDLVHLLLTLMQSDLVPEILGAAREEIAYQCLSSAKARTLLKWAPAYDLEEALVETIGWYRRHVAASAEEPARLGGQDRTAGRRRHRVGGRS